MQNKQNTKAKVIVVAIAILLCLALAVGITGAFYQARRRATGTVKMDKGIVIDYTGFGKEADGVWVRENETSFRLFSDTDVQPGEKISPVDSGIRANASSVDFYARVKLSYEFYNGETPVEFAESTKLIKTSSSFFGTNWVESGDGYYYYAAGSTLNKFEKGTQTFVDLFATDAKFIIEGAGFTGATSDGEGGGFRIDESTSINKIEVYLTLETLQGDADAAAEGWKITEVVKPIEIDVATEEKPDINIDDIISDDKKDGEITISGNPTTMKTILIGSRAFEGCTNLRLKLTNSANITYVIATDAFSEGAKIWYGANEATNLLINADTTGKTAGQANAWVVAEPNLKLFLPTGVTQNSTNKSYGKYQYTDDQGTWYFDLIDSNGNTVTLSSNNNMSVSTLGASTYANTNTYTAKLRKFVPNEGITIVNIPKFIGISNDSDKYAVTELYETFQNCSGLTSITIPGSVTSIKDYVFDGCSGLTSITIPNSVTSIGYAAIRECSSLTSITIPDSITRIDVQTFYYCSGLTSITIPDSVTSIGLWAFRECSSLTSITIPDSVTSIGDEAFRECSSLTSMHIGAGIREVSWLPDNVAEITISISKNNPYLTTDSKAIFAKSNGELSVLEYISADTTYDIPSAVDSLSVTSIGGNAFDNCSSLQTITIPNSVTTIGSSAFSLCSSLQTITIPNSITTIGSIAFSYCSSLTSITIPDRVTSIGTNAFQSCSGLTSMHIGAGIQEVSWLPNNVSKIVVTISKDNPYLATDSRAIFAKSNGELSVSKYISSDETYNIPSAVDSLSVTSIGQKAFYNCSSLKSITIPDSVTSIGNSAFSGCSRLTLVTIGNGVTSIGDNAFNNCRGLTSITIPDSVTSIGNSAFSSCSSLTSITIPDSVTSIGNSAFSGCHMTSITIPDSVTSIGNSVFYNCSRLTSITIPDSVTSIGEYAFYYCSSLTSITIPDSVTSIGNYAFNYCTGLKSITIPDSVTSIGNYAFMRCSGLTSAVIKGNIPKIPSYCFGDCSSLKSIVLPSSITTIEAGAFRNCSKLTTIYVDSADSTLLGFTKVDDTLYNENGIVDASGKYYKYSGTIA